MPPAYAGRGKRGKHFVFRAADDLSRRPG